MSKADASRLKIGDRVRWIEDGAEGEIVECDYSAIRIAWSDGQMAILSRSEHAELIERA